eukprot:1511941-Amphidinium_carterae.2
MAGVDVPRGADGTPSKGLEEEEEDEEEGVVLQNIHTAWAEVHTVATSAIAIAWPAVLAFGDSRLMLQKCFVWRNGLSGSIPQSDTMLIIQTEEYEQPTTNFSIVTSHSAIIPCGCVTNLKELNKSYRVKFCMTQVKVHRNKVRQGLIRAKAA